VLEHGTGSFSSEELKTEAQLPASFTWHWPEHVAVPEKFENLFGRPRTPAFRVVLLRKPSADEIGKVKELETGLSGSAAMHAKAVTAAVERLAVDATEDQGEDPR
jgi:hypothetical protein